MFYSSQFYSHHIWYLLLCYMVIIFGAEQSIPTHSSVLFSFSWMESVLHFHFEKGRARIVVDTAALFQTGL